MKALYLENCQVVEHRKVNDTDWIMTLKTDLVAAESKPGQFVQVKVADGLEPILRRPISIHTVDTDKKELQLYYQVLGKGTEIMSRIQTGETVSLLGPLGNGFDLSLENSKALLVGGGLGQAPLLFLAEELEKKNNAVFLALGTRDEVSLKNVICFNDVCQEVSLATEDGSLGFKGYITDQMPEIIERFRPEMIYACGPNPMMQKIKDIAASYQIPCEVSLETRMACGIGVCLGCTVRPVDSDKPYFKACVDGPVFKAEEVLLDEEL